ncbi:MAG TPA: DEAD/DEAH box helicase, partial [Solirubrobacterales bacterium]|nr:DEAD/DEAH box helicase [Solirubrobacterales bacterium]
DPANDEVQAIVLTPTRELCIQVTQALRAYAEHLDVEIVAVFGGAPIKSQQAQLRAGAQVVVATVGRMMDLMSRQSLVLTAARYVVLDEADEMLDLGFIEDVEKILRLCPSGRQTALFSATMPPPIERLANTQMYEPVVIKVTPKQLTVDKISQAYVETDKRGKTEKLIEVLKAEEPEQAIIFCRTKIGASRLEKTLKDRGLDVKALHGDMSQGSRDGVMIAFKDHRVKLLVATDIAARGLDIEHVTHVINFDLPNNSEIYVHRIGRTGRVGRTGRAITFVTPKERGELERIERDVKTSIGEWEPPEERLDHAPRPKRRHERRRERERGGESKPVEWDTAAPEESAVPAAEAIAIAPEPEEAEAAAPSTEAEAEGARAPTGGPPPVGNGHVKLFINRGSRSGIAEEDIRWALEEGAVVPDDAIHDVRVLERFTFVDLDDDQAEKALDRLDGTKLKGKQIRLEYANG